MKPSMFAFCLASLLTLAGTIKASESTASPAIRPVSQCLRTDRISDWKVIDDQHLMVKSLGSRYFDIHLTTHCPRLTSSSYIGFRDGVQPLMQPTRRAGNAPGQNPTTTDGRICGDIGDAVIPQSGTVDATQPPCDIASIRRVDEETWKSAKKASR